MRPMGEWLAWVARCAWLAALRVYDIRQAAAQRADAAGRGDAAAVAGHGVPALLAAPHSRGSTSAAPGVPGMGAGDVKLGSARRLTARRARSLGARGTAPVLTARGCRWRCGCRTELADVVRRRERVATGAPRGRGGAAPTWEDGTRVAMDHCW